MALINDKIKVIPHIGGRIINDGLSVTYDRPHKKLFRVSRSMRLCQFVSILYERCEIDSAQYLLKLFGKLRFVCQDVRRDVISEITNDEDLQLYFDPVEGHEFMEVFIETKVISSSNEMPNVDVNTTEWGRYISLSSDHRSPNMSNVGSIGLNEHIELDVSENIPNLGVGTSTPGFHNVGHLTPDAVATTTNGMSNMDFHNIDGAHSYAMGGMSDNHLNLNVNYIAAIISNAVRSDPSCKVELVQEIVRRKLGLNIPYMKAHHALKRCRDNIFGTWESSMRRLPRYMKALVRKNPGTIVEWHHDVRSQLRRKIIGYVFWAFKPCIDGFAHCRRVISVDRTCIYTKYKHNILIAMCFDANQKVLPLAWAIVDDESTVAWTWFFKMLDKHVFSKVTEKICFISDLGTDIISAFQHLPECTRDRIVHRYCLSYVCSEFHEEFKSQTLEDFVFSAGSKHQICKLNSILERIKAENLEAYNYLAQIDKEKWTLANDGGWRCGVLTTNMYEAISGTNLRVVRKLPITAIVETTFHEAIKTFQKGKSNVIRMQSCNKQRWSDYACAKFSSWRKKSMKHVVRMSDSQSQVAEVVTKGRHSGAGGHTHTVDWREKVCTCGKWSLYGIPCSHAQAMARTLKLDPSNFVRSCYNVTAYDMTYAGVFHLLMCEENWEDPDFELFHNDRLLKVTYVGRRQSTCNPNETDLSQGRVRQQGQAIRNEQN